MGLNHKTSKTLFLFLITNTKIVFHITKAKSELTHLQTRLRIVYDLCYDRFICLEQQIRSQSSSSQGFVTLSSRPHSEQVYTCPSAIFPIFCSKDKILLYLKLEKLIILNLRIYQM